MHSANLNSLEDIQGLESVHTLDISNCPNLTDINCPNINERLAFVRIHDNPNLQTIKAGNHILPITTKMHLEIKDNPELASIEGFSNIQNYSMVNIQNCPKLNNINDLFNSVQKAPLLYIKNTNIKSFGPFQNPFPKYAQNIEISNNDSLTSIQGLLGLHKQSSTSNQDWIKLNNNPQLTSIKGLDSLKSAIIINLLNTGIENLKPLANLDSMKLSILIGSPNIENLSGLENWKYAGGGPYLRASSLKNIDAIVKH